MSRSVRLIAGLQAVRNTSRSVPFRPHETALQRHARRFSRAQQDRERFESWCWRRGLRVLAEDEGEAWRIVSDDGDTVATWRPRTALLAYPSGRKRHLHDVDQVQGDIGLRVLRSGGTLE